MQVPTASVVGREPELAIARQFVEETGHGPAALVLEGIAGIGKTAIWAEAVRQARAQSVAVRGCRCGESDVGWVFAGLGDLFDGLDPAVLGALPAIQREALSAALLLDEGSDRGPGLRVVGVAVLSVLRQLARSGPLLLAVDDIQWLDPSSRTVLTFALRRLVDEPVRLLVSVRTGGVDHAAGAELGLRAQRIAVGPVSLGVLQRIVTGQLGHAFSRPTLTRLYQATGGNPMACLEMARALQRRGREPAVDEPLPVPADLAVLVTERLHGLTGPARHLLLVAAALARPTVATVAAAVGEPEPATGALAEVVRAGLLHFDGERIHFTHPLIASIPYAALTPVDRRRLHTELASTVHDPEEHARHAALGTVARSATVAAALDLAAGHARRRGSLTAATELAELALRRTPVDDSDALLRRTVDAAECLFLLGDTGRARTVLDDGLAAARPGPARVRGLLLAATIASWEQGDATVAARCQQALTEAGDDPLLQAYCHATLADTSPSGAVEDLFHAVRAVELLESLDAPPPDLLSNALTNVAAHGCRLGRGLATPLLERAVALQAQAPPNSLNESAALGLGMYLKVVDRFDESRQWLHTVRAAALDAGDDSALPNTLGHLATLEIWAGHYETGLAYAVEGRDLAERTGLSSPVPNSAHVLALAYLGRLDEARERGRADLAADQARGFTAAAALHYRSLGAVELISGDPTAAATHLLSALAISVEEFGIREPAILRAHADAVAALVALGRTVEAELLTGQLDVSTAANHLPWSTALGRRCRGLLRGAAGDLPGAIELLQAAVVDHERLPMPFEAAQTRMVLAGFLRRAGRRGEARREYESALGVFDRLGTPVQAAQAVAELAGIGGRTAVQELTTVEQRIAELVGAGQTNREVAAVLFLSVRTVESHLGRIYRKLGLRSRTELSRHLRA